MARVIVTLRELDFDLATIGEILAGSGDDGSILEFLEQQRRKLCSDIERRREIVQTLDAIITQEKQERTIMEKRATRRTT